MQNGFPSYSDCPAALRKLDGNCGPIALWMVLRHFRKRMSSHAIIRACRHAPQYGTFTIALAVVLRESGLNVVFHSDRDLRPHRIEREMYRRAGRLGIEVLPSLSIAELTDALRSGQVALVYFDSDERTGHFSPLISIDNRRLILPNADRGSMPIAEFERKWSSPDICRQCVLVSS